MKSKTVTRGIHFTIILFTLMIIPGCVSVSFAPTRTGYEPVKEKSHLDIEVYRTEIPDRTFKEIGTIYVYGGGKIEKLIQIMKEEAARQGGDAVIDIRTTSDGVIGTLILFE